jgi:transposase
MVFQRTKPHVVLKPEEKARLEKIIRSGKSEKKEYDIARIIIMNHEDKGVNSIASELDTKRTRVYLVIDKAITFGVDKAMKDLPGRGRNRTIGDKTRSFVIKSACTKPSELGYTYEMWTNRLLTEYIRKNALEEYGLRNISNGTVSKILTKSNIRPHKIRYYMEKTDPEHENKQAEVLHVYREVKILRGENESAREMLTAILSYDEKPGIQAIRNIYIDKPPDETNGYVSRNHDYRRNGTLSLMAGIDLVSGHIIPLIEDRHRSMEFVKWLELVDSYYPEDYMITIILDNHSVHTSKETMRHLSSRQWRFHFVFTPTHASWLNIIEMFFSKMARSMLRGIRVESKKELKVRMIEYIQDLNNDPIVFIWNWKIDEMPGGKMS